MTVPLVISRDSLLFFDYPLVINKANKRAMIKPIKNKKKRILEICAAVPSTP